MAEKLTAVAVDLDFDSFVGTARRVIPTDDEVTAVLALLDRDTRSMSDGAALAARRLRLAQYAGAWLGTPPIDEPQLAPEV